MRTLKRCLSKRRKIVCFIYAIFMLCILSLFHSVRINKPLLNILTLMHGIHPFHHTEYVARNALDSKFFGLEPSMMDLCFQNVSTHIPAHLIFSKQKD